MEYVVPGLPAGVGVQGLLVEVGVDLARHLNPLQQLPRELVVLGENLAVVSDHIDPALRGVVGDLDGPEELPHLQVVGAVIPVLRLLPQPVVVRAQDGEESVALGPHQVVQLGLLVQILECGLAQGDRLGGVVGVDPGSYPGLLVVAQLVGEEAEGTVSLAVYQPCLPSTSRAQWLWGRPCQ